MTRNRFFAKTILAMSFAILGSTAAMAQQDSTALTPPAILENVPDWAKDIASRIELHGYAHAGYSYTHRDLEHTNTFYFKRAVFWANARITDRWSFLFMYDFASVVQEFYTEYRLTRNKALTVRLGQFKNAVSLENAYSPSVLEAVDVRAEGVSFLAGGSGDPLYGTQYGRDLGLSLYGETNNGKLRYELQVMNGQGVNRKDGNNTKDVIARLDFRPVKGLNIVATGQIGRGHAVATSVYNPAIQVGQNYTRNRWTAGVEYKNKAFKVRSEYLEGHDGDVVSRGAYLTGSVPLGTPKVEFVGSYDFFNYNTALDMNQHKVIAGFQYWYYKRCRLQLQYVYRNAYLANGQFLHNDSHALMCQMQIRFN